MALRTSLSTALILFVAATFAKAQAPQRDASARPAPASPQAQGSQSAGRAGEKKPVNHQEKRSGRQAANLRKVGKGK